MLTTPQPFLCPRLGRRCSWLVSEILDADYKLTGLFPPSSRVTFFKFDDAEAFKIALPVAVEPVKATLLMSMCEAMAFPAVLPYPDIKFTVPAGKPASWMSSHIFNADNGVASADLMTTVFPVAKAGAIFQTNMRSGKLCSSVRHET